MLSEGTQIISVDKKSIFTISLDFELHWGGFEKWPLNESKKSYFLRTRELIPNLLKLFADNDIHATWATVGLLMHENKAALERNLPKLPVSYDQEHLSAFHYLKTVGIGENEQEDPFHYADSLVRQIIQTPGQELGTHTFGHYYCNEAGQTIDMFRADLQSAQAAAEVYGKQLSSLVFPRNQFNEAYLQVCATEGIRIARSNPIDWWWQIGSTQQESLWKRLNRGMDAYFSIGGKTSYPLDNIKQVGGVYLMPASRLLRPYNAKELFLNNRKISRIKSEMSLAAQNGEVYHLWWHPHNFGGNPAENMKGMQEIANHFQYLKKIHGMESLSMGEVVGLLEEREKRKEKR